MELHNFPFDTQALSIEIQSKLEKYEILLTPTDHQIPHYDIFTQDKFIDQQKW